MYTIVDIDECSANRGICGDGGTCVNRAGSYTCQCNSGYQLRNRKCEGKHDKTIPAIHTYPTDINECSNPSRCGTNSRCVNLPGSYRCNCNSGYTLRRGRCTGRSVK